MSPLLPVPLERGHALSLLEHMLRIRRFEEKCAELYGQQKIRGFLHLYIGEEAVAAGAVPLLGADDALVCTYREHGHALARGIPMRNVMAEMYGKRDGCSRGRGGSMHLFDAARRFYGGNAIVGGLLPMAAGLALADRMQARPRVTAVFFGEGAVAEGAFHETMNLAALWHVPLLLCCENNLYAMGTHIARSESQVDLAVKAAGYGIDAVSVDGMDVVAVHRAAKDAIARVRESGRPAFVEFRTYRFRAHSMFDAELYRDKAEVDAWKARGPLHTFTDRLKAQGLMTESDFQDLDARVLAELAAAVEFAEQSAWEPAGDLLRDVQAERAP